MSLVNDVLNDRQRRRAMPLLLLAAVLAGLCWQAAFAGAIQGFQRTNPSPEAVGRYTLHRELVRAQASIAAGRPAAGVERLQMLLAEAPEYHPAREYLIALLIEAGEREWVLDELRLASERWPEHSRYALWHARFLLEAGNAAGAIRLLETAPPSDLSDGEYRALLAAAYQREGRYAQALSAYRALTISEPDHGPWWLGLALAAEGAGHVEKAEQAYRRVVADGRLNTELRRFAEQRLNSL
ncbi:hypothetical protein CAI21_13285 [Alkalilimnicola ehrlichii]|uniref:Uncharacterized protein n=1 Tax=Alkalilimnicola ehrlichii TaxID=351052 RepID=A0A3E0WPH8_9GAMM|nr:tetratricopeptide repeat protein [Alkalilimnicola ehrlichii]RFA28284.1 hypothetical protein CAI21_13285 [Alkalilimnicola ehrlichii]RFA34884.1 hypothetical protein CAL65_14420 [Alkalilimnicola ehrlichii]